jgi:acyl-CoA synthetase (AMP-forming)/AMP-acid ligase II
MAANTRLLKTFSASPLPITGNHGEVSFSAARSQNSPPSKNLWVSFCQCHWRPAHALRLAGLWPRARHAEFFHRRLEHVGGLYGGPVTTIVTSRKFIEAAEMENDLAVLAKSCAIIYLEDVREAIGKRDKLYGLFTRFFPRLALRLAKADRNPDSPAIVLFTSAQRACPKGVVLSHRNLNANRLQAAARIGFSAQDIVFNAMPMFHAFGLLGGTLLPVLSGVYSFFYPSPLHYKIVPELCYDTNATVLYGTDTFLAGYARTANPYDFFSMRLIVSGAERVKPETREIWMEKFGHRILEGYGATECSPVIAINTPMHNRSGSVGRLMDPHRIPSGTRRRHCLGRQAFCEGSQCHARLSAHR